MQLDFSYVSHEIRSIVSRRRDIMLFLSSLFAAVGIYLQNILQGNLPDALKALEGQSFLSYSIIILIPSTLLALRIAKLHSGMVINGIFYSYILQQKLGSTKDPAGAAKLNWTGVSTQLFLLTNIIASWAILILFQALNFNPLIAFAFAIIYFFIFLIIFKIMHSNAAHFSLEKIKEATVLEIDEEEVVEHRAYSLQDCNHDMLATLAFVGLMLFSILEMLSGLGQNNGRTLTESAQFLTDHAPFSYGLLAVVTSVMSAIIYLRLSISIGRFSLEIDPTDKPFNPFKLTDSMLGYFLLAFFLTVSVHLFIFPALGGSSAIWIMDIFILIMAWLAYPLTLIVAGSKFKK